VRDVGRSMDWFGAGVCGREGIWLRWEWSTGHWAGGGDDLWSMGHEGAGGVLCCTGHPEGGEGFDVV
jgi:hypothetical protein